MGKNCPSQQDSMWKAQTQETMMRSGKGEFPMAGRESRWRGGLEDTIKQEGRGSRSRLGNCPKSGGKLAVHRRWGSAQMAGWQLGPDLPFCLLTWPCLVVVFNILFI